MFIEVSSDYYSSSKKDLINSENIDYIREADCDKFNSVIYFKGGNQLYVREWTFELKRMLCKN